MNPGSGNDGSRNIHFHTNQSGIPPQYGYQQNYYGAPQGVPQSYPPQSGGGFVQQPNYAWQQQQHQYAGQGMQMQYGQPPPMQMQQYSQYPQQQQYANQGTGVPPPPPGAMMGAAAYPIHPSTWGPNAPNNNAPQMYNQHQQYQQPVQGDSVPMPTVNVKKGGGKNNQKNASVNNKEKKVPNQQQQLGTGAGTGSKNENSTTATADGVAATGTSPKIFLCEPCDKEFTAEEAYNAHTSTHEYCQHPGCKFNGTKKVVVAHFHGTHGEYSGTGYKNIDVEGTSFRVLLGTSPEEVEQWRAARRKKFPSAANVTTKQEDMARLDEAGGVSDLYLEL